jgi:hypothetical protein
MKILLPDMTEVEVVIKVPEGIPKELVEKMVRRELEKKGERLKTWEKLFGVAKNAPEFREEDRVDARV